jgi:hypothetical protein
VARAAPKLIEPRLGRGCGTFHPSTRSRSQKFIADVIARQRKGRAKRNQKTFDGFLN